MLLLSSSTANVVVAAQEMSDVAAANGAFAWLFNLLGPIFNVLMVACGWLLHPRCTDFWLLLPRLDAVNGPESGDGCVKYEPNKKGGPRRERRVVQVPSGHVDVRCRCRACIVYEDVYTILEIGYI